MEGITILLKGVKMEGFEAVVHAVTVAVLLYCAGKDIQTKKIFAGWILFLLAIGIFLQVLAGNQVLFRIMTGSTAGIALRLIGRLTQEAIGKGDGDLTIALGIQTGFFGSMELLMYAFLFSASFSVLLLLCKKADRKKRIPFVPFLLLGYLGVLLF